MALTPEQASKRHLTLGASEISALFTDSNGYSLNPYMNARDVWYHKVFQKEKEFDNASRKTGRRLEPLIMEWAAEELGVAIETNPEKLNFVSEQYPILSCNLDGYTLTDPCCAVEAKSSNKSDDFGEPGTDEVPYRVLLQTQQQLLVCRWSVAYIPVFKIMFGITEHMYVVESNKQIQEAIIDRAYDFWENNVVKQVEPEGAELPSLETLKAVARVPNKLAEIDTSLVNEWLDLKALKKEYEDKTEIKYREILAKLVDAEGAILEGGDMVTYFSQNGKAKVDLDYLKQNHAEIYAKIVTPTRTRVLRFKKSK